MTSWASVCEVFEFACLKFGQRIDFVVSRRPHLRIADRSLTSQSRRDIVRECRYRADARNEQFGSDPFLDFHRAFRPFDFGRPSTFVGCDSSQSGRSVVRCSCRTRVLSQTRQRRKWLERKDRLYWLERVSPSLSESCARPCTVATEVIVPIIHRFGLCSSFYPFPNDSLYGASKHAVLGLCKSLGPKVFDEGITVK